MTGDHRPVQVAPTPVRDVLPRLRRQACHDRPATTAPIGNPAGQAHGTPPIGWMIALD